MFIFFGLAIGLASEVGYHKMAIFGSLFIGLMILLLTKSNFTSTKPNDYLLQFAFHPNGYDSPPYMPILNKYCKKYNIINAKIIENQEIIELAYYVKFKNKGNNPEFIRELNSAHGVKNISLFFDEVEIKNFDKD